MDLIADILLVTGALAAGFYCYVLSRRLSRFTDLETGVGGAVAVLSAQVDDLSRTLGAAQKAAGASAGTLEAITTRAEDAARKLELMLASMHDLHEKEEARLAAEREAAEAAEAAAAAAAEAATAEAAAEAAKEDEPEDAAEEKPVAQEAPPAPAVMPMLFPHRAAARSAQ